MGKKGNETTEMIVGASAKKLEMALKSMKEAFAGADALDTLINEKTLKLTNLEDEFELKKKELENLKAQNRIDLKNQFEYDKKSFVDTYATMHKMTMIPTVEFETLNSRIAELEADNETEIKQKVAEAVGSATSRFNNEIRVAKLEHEKKESENMATIKSLAEKVTFLERQVDTWKTALDEERKAGVERAKASAVGSVNVTSGK